MPFNSSRLIRAMQRADFYPHAVDYIEMLQTHASWIFLTGPFAYKVKKPVDFGFLDFSTLEKRQHFCEEELRLNRRLAPELYLEVLPISYDAQRCFLLGSDHHICDYCLKMMQFDQTDLLGTRLSKGHFDDRWMDMLATDIAAFHARTAPSPAASRYGRETVLAKHIDASLNTAARHIGRVIDKQALVKLRVYTTSRLERYDALFAARIATGRIRDSHGDLHLGNITLYDDHPLVFDCIEFNEEYRIIDILNDAAFLVMDCEARGRPDLAFRFLSRYLECSGDYTGMPLLPLFLSYRAGVRGKVACLLAADPDINDAEREAKLDEATHYFALALGYLEKKSNPRLFIIGGLSGSGKSYLALQGCGIERAVIIRSDATRKRIARDSPGEELYTQGTTSRTYDSMFKAAKFLLGAGWSVILDATFLSPDFRQQARNIATGCGVPYRLLWLDVARKNLRRNIARRRSKGRDVSDADLDVLERQLAAYQRPQEAGIHFLTNSDHWPGA